MPSPYQTADARVRHARDTNAVTLDLSALSLGEPVTNAAELRDAVASLKRTQGVSREADAVQESAATPIDRRAAELNLLFSRLGQLKQLRSLNLAGTGLATFPVDLCQLEFLTELDLSSNSLTDLPKAFTRLKNLVTLRLCNNAFAIYPQVLSRLGMLKTLDLGGNALAAIPDTIVNLARLTTLALRNNRFTSIPSSICRLGALESLLLSQNQILEVTPAIAAPQRLMHIDLSRNLLRSFPEPASRMPLLVSLNLAANQIASIGESVAFPQNLAELDLSDNSLESIPEAFSQMSRLEALDLSGNNLAEVPESITRITKLRKLLLNRNRITRLPPTLTRFQDLTALQMESNGLIEVSDSVAHLGQLESLDLAHNRITTVTDSIGKCRRLASLDLTDNIIERLPDGIADLTALEWMSLARNRLVEIPPGMARMDQVCQLDLSVNRLGAIPAPLYELRGLIALGLAKNGISHVADKIGRLRQLQWLDLGDNAIADLPDTLGEIESLQEVYLAKNVLSRIPQSLTQHRNLRVLDIRENPQLSVPPELAERFKEPESILRYFSRLNNVLTARPLAEAKVMVLGQGGVGKTSLVRMLVDGRCNERENKTEGIDIRRWDIGAGQDKVRLNIWDFGGQEILHATHQFFLTKRSVYLLVVDARQGEADGRLDYWLKIIESFGGTSPVVIVTNKSDQQRLELNERGLLGEHPSIFGFVPTACHGAFELGELTKNGISDLRRMIETAVLGLPHVYDMMPESWLSIKTELEGMKENYITEMRYEEICSRAGVTDPDDRTVLIRLLNDLGSVIHYHDDRRLHDTNILNPEWVTQGIYRILNDTRLFEDRGVFARRRLSEILDPSIYPRDRHEFLIGMMRKFELCFPFEGEDEFLIPELLSKLEPDLQEGHQGALCFEYWYRVLPSSVVSRFIVRVHKLIVRGMLWRTGVVLNVHGNRIVVEAQMDALRIRVAVKGNENTRREALAVVRGHFDHIHGTIPGLHPEERVPVPGQSCKAVSYQHLLELERRGLREFLPEGGDAVVSVGWMLAGVERPRVENARDTKLQPRSAADGEATRVHEKQESSSPWRSGGFYLVVVVVAFVLIVGAASVFGWGMVATAFVATTLVATLIIIAQLRNDGRIKDASFVALATAVLERLHLFRRRQLPGTAPEKPEE